MYHALYSRHTWAVWDTRAVVWFTINGELMGGETRAAKGEKLTAELILSAEDSLQAVKVISGGRSIWCKSFAERDISTTIDLGSAEESTYFYVRALQRNGGIIIASPVFVDIG